MAPTEALEQEPAAKKGEITRSLPEEQRQIAPAVWLRGDLLAEEWRSYDYERAPDVAAYYTRGHDHDETTIGSQANSCISCIHDSGEVTLSISGQQMLEEQCSSSTTPPLAPISTSNSIRLNRFERRQRDGEEDMHLLIIRRQVKRQTNGELKFRTDFDSCFKDFPLENLYAPHWTCRTPVSAQASVRNFCEPSVAAVEKPPVLSRQHEELEECDIYEYAKLHGLMDDVILPRNSDGTLMAELDATPIEHSSEASIGTTSRPARSSALITTTASVPRVAPNRLAKKLAALHPLSWARRSSLHIKQKRDSGQNQRMSTPESVSTATELIHSPITPWKIEATEDGLLYYHSAFEKDKERSVPSLVNSASSPIELAVSPGFPSPLSMMEDDGDECHSEDGSDLETKVEEVAVGGCWVTIASTEQ